MNLLQKQSTLWIESFKTWYQTNQNLINAAFTYYYDEYDKETINNNLNNINFLFSLSDAAYLSCKNIPNNAFTKNLIQYFKLNKIVLDTLRRRGAGNKRLLGEATKQNMLFKYCRNSLEYLLYEEFTDDPSNALTYIDIKEKSSDIILPIYFLNEHIIFHELNHIFTTPKERKGLFPSTEVDELLNDLISRDILKIFNSLGGKILPYKLTIKNTYDNDLFLMEEFYIKFKSLIKRCVQVGDISILEKTIGKENLRIYFNLVKKLYHQRIITDIDMRRIKFLIYFMEEYSKRNKTCYNGVKIRKKNKIRD